jgi:exopolysaccharide biosynthesis WecB/TagA/CpsF family protein
MKVHDFFGLSMIYGTINDLEVFFRDQSVGKVLVGLHVGSFPSISDGTFPKPDGFENVYFYPDGISTVLLLKSRGCKGVERLPTTDAGWNLLEYSGEKVQTLGLIGASHSVNVIARDILAERGYKVVWSFNGYSELEKSLDKSLPSPDCIIVGLGMPLEMQHSLKLLNTHRGSRILTCGGWLGFIAGSEKRAPKLFQNVGLEWFWRLTMNPQRLFSRYVNGAISFVRLYFMGKRKGRK